MRKNKIINLVVAFAILFVSIIPFLIFRYKIELSKYSPACICLLALHLIYGLVVFCFRHKGNFIRIRIIFFRYFWFNLIEPNKDYTYTETYVKTFNRMLALYFSVVPMYIPCIFLIHNKISIPLAVAIFLIPQIIFKMFEIYESTQNIKDYIKKKQIEEKEKKEQEKREKMGYWK